MEFLSACAAKAMELMVQPICRQIGYFFSYNRNMDGLKEQLRNLSNDGEAVQHLIDEAENRGDQIEKQVIDWQERVQEISVQVQEFIENESHAKIDCCYKRCPNPWLRLQLSRRAKEKIRQVVEIKGVHFRSVGYRVPEQGVDLLASSSTGNEATGSRLLTVDAILEALSDNKINVVGLCGVAGVGKTTLADQVAKKAVERQQFDLVISVRVGREPNPVEIQKQIAKKVGLKFGDESETVRARRLCEKLKRLNVEKNILVVLDDFWESLDIKKLGFHFADVSKSESSLAIGHNNAYKILLTSRNLDVLRSQMNCKRNIELGVLPEKEALELFNEMAELPVDSDQSLLSIAAEVAKRCGGLPLALVAVARALRNNTNPDDWRNALRALEEPMLRDATLTGEVDTALKYSYDSLPTKELKSTFLLSAMLSLEPSIKELFMYSLGLGLLHLEVNTLKQAQDKLNVLVSKLKASSLLMDGSSNDRLKIHDVVRDFAMSKMPWWLSTKS